MYRGDLSMRQWRACDTWNGFRYLGVVASVPPHEQVFGLFSCKYFVKKLDFEHLHTGKKGTSRFPFSCQRKK